VDFKLTAEPRNVGLLRIFSRIPKIWIVATLAAVAAFSGRGYAQNRKSLATGHRPDDFVDLKSVAPSIIVDIRYSGSHNFVGRPIPGYDADKCLLTQPAAEALANVQRQLTAFGFSLLIYDCYRPQRAVDYFVKWAAGSSDNSMKSEFYPHLKKDDLFKDGYIASPSSHSRGSTVDLTIVTLPRSNIEVYAAGDPLTACDEQASSRFRDGSLDMGTGYDCFDPRAHVMASGQTSQQRANRMLLATLMEQVGFAGYANEWWHFTLRNEPYPNTYFDFPIR
jgi:zinc D-Ala-D-Ala dipeptidase